MMYTPSNPRILPWFLPSAPFLISNAYANKTKHLGLIIGLKCN